MLLGGTQQSGANPDTVDEHSRTPSSKDAEKRHETIVMLLLGRNDVGSNAVGTMMATLAGYQGRE